MLQGRGKPAVGRKGFEYLIDIGQNPFIDAIYKQSSRETAAIAVFQAVAIKSY